MSFTHATDPVSATPSTPAQCARLGRRAGAAAVLAAICALGDPVAAQNTKLERDIAFVRNMAGRLRFISLAQSEVDQMKLRYKKREDNLAVDQLGVQVSLIGAKVHRNREEKRTLYKDAIERCQTILESVSTGPVALAARMTLADATSAFGGFLSDEVEIARIEAPAKVEGLEKEAATVFQAGEDACDEVLKALRGKDDDASKRDYYLSWMAKGILLREHARAVKKDRSYLVDRSRDTLEELIFDIGEDTVLGQRALFEYAQNDEVTGDLDGALQGYQDVIDSADSVLMSEDLNLSLPAREQMVQTLEEAYDRIAATQFEQGDPAKVLMTVDEYRKHLEKLDVPLTDLNDPEKKLGNEDKDHGHSLYLTAARAMAESGDAAKVSQALMLVRFFNDKHPADFVGIRAKTVLKDILEMQSSGVTGALLLEVAKGDYLAKNYEAAIQGFKKAIGAMNQAELASIGLEAYWRMGQCMALQGRVLEAAHALEIGLTNHASGAQADMREKAATLIQQAMNQVRLNSKHDSFFDGLNNTVGRLASTYGSVGDAGKRLWNEARRHAADKKYDLAITSFQRIKPGALHYEWSQARIAKAQQGKRDFKAARDTIGKFRVYLGTKDAKIPDDRGDLRQARAIAEGEIAFTEAYMLYLEGIGKGASAKKDLTKFPEVTKLLSDFESQHGKALAHMVSHVNFMLGKSYLEMGNMAKAEERYRLIRQASASDPNLPAFATALFGAYNNQVTRKAIEVKELERGEDQAALARGDNELAVMRRQTMALGLDYFENSASPQYGIAFLTLQQAEALADWDKVETFGTKVVTRFETSSSPEEKQKVDKFVRPVVARAMLQQHKYRQAYDLLVAAEKASPKNYAVKRLICLALGGWQEIDKNGRIQAYLGLGKPAEAYDKYWTEYKTAGLNRVQRYTLPWYKFHWEVYHFANTAAQNDTKFRDRARALYGKAQSTDDFEHLNDLGRDGAVLYQLFQSNAPR